METGGGWAFVIGAGGAVYSYLFTLVTILPELIQLAWLPGYQKSSILIYNTSDRGGDLMGKELQQEQKSRAQIQKEAVRLNQQINFLVMRYMWQRYKGRAKKNTKYNRTIYDVLGISRERYTRVLDGQVASFGVNKLTRINQITNVSMEIFNGSKAFQFKKIGLHQWKDLFDCRVDNIAEFREKAKELFNLIEEGDFTKKSDLYKFRLFCEKLAKYDGVSHEVAVREITRVLEARLFSDLEECSLETLESYQKVLAEQSAMVNTLLSYRKYKNKTAT